MATNGIAGASHKASSLEISHFPFSALFPKQSDGKMNLGRLMGVLNAPSAHSIQHAIQMEQRIKNLIFNKSEGVRKKR